MKMLPETIGTAIVGALVAAAVILIIRKMIKDKKAGKNSCGCGCGSCPNAGFCHKK
ncbi:MAG: FeoB-associated Cys-rich membrane protein [Firmicutes bacterium]|nr:FeoB-associated Cys-rich membrane protein [Bacillota bacterium]